MMEKHGMGERRNGENGESANEGKEDAEDEQAPPPSRVSAGK